MQRVVLVDGNALVYRAFFALPPHLTTRAGVHTNAVFGFASMFKKLFAGKRPSYGAIVFDPPGPTTRDLKYPAYKAQRSPMPMELVEQLPLIDRVVEANRFPRIRVPGLEADDVIGTLARRALDLGHEVAIVSSDKDFAQMVGERLWMQDTIKDVSYDAELVKKKWGVSPHQMIDLLALMGDSSDNIPGVDGIGQKGAQQLLEQYGSLKGIFAAFEQTPDAFKGRVKSALAAGRDSALLSYDLATIDQHAAVPTTWEELKIEAPDANLLNPLYKELELYSLLARDVVAEAKASQAIGGVLTLCETPDAVRAALKDVEGSTALVALFDGGHIHGTLVGVALSSRAGQALYVPINDDTLKALVSFLQDPKAPKVLHNAKELMVLLSQRHITLRGISFDTQLASFLVDPNKLLAHHHDLPSVTKEFLQRTIPALKDLTGAGKSEKLIANVDVMDAAKYAAELVYAVRELLGPLSDAVKAMEQDKNLFELDIPLSSVLAQMEIDGICVDVPLMTSIGVELAQRLAEIEQRIHAHAKRAFNIGSPKQLGDVLFDELKLPVIKRTKTGYSTDAEVLQRLAPKHAIAQEILEHRRLDKLINTYTDVLVRDVHPNTGRVHATFQQTVGVTGRLITMDPDLQRTPVKTAEGQRIREAFVAQPLKDGTATRIIDADWSQIELRLLAHVSGDAILVECFNAGVDVHRRTAAEIFDVEPAEISKLQREVGKTVNFSTIYGQGAIALSQMLGVTKKDADHYIARYFDVYSGVKAWLTEQIAIADELGYATTLLGRRRIIPQLKSRSPMDRGFGERIAANTPIQGSAADICKLAMLKISAQLKTRAPRTRMLLQIHDELVFESPLDEVDAACDVVKSTMQTVVQLRVPLIADVGVGGSWGHAK